MEGLRQLNELVELSAQRLELFIIWIELQRLVDLVELLLVLCELVHCKIARDEMIEDVSGGKGRSAYRRRPTNGAALHTGPPVRPDHPTVHSAKSLTQSTLSLRTLLHQRSQRRANMNAIQVGAMER